MNQYIVTGMSCAACQARVEKAVNAVEGVESCAVSLLTNSMGVEGTASVEAIMQAVEAVGYGASLKTGSVNPTAPDDSSLLKDTETPKMRRRLVASVIILIPLMYVSMGNMLWNWPLPSFLEGNHVAIGLYELLLSGMVMIINQKFFINGFKGLINKSPNMDTLVALGAFASYGYSIYALFAMTSEVIHGTTNMVMYYHNQFYFESAAMILTLITVGKMLEARSKGKTTNALKSLMSLAPKTAIILIDGQETLVPIDNVKVGDHFIVRPGDSIPVDGTVIDGHSAVNESTLTGESLPIDKQPGDLVSAATINTSGYMVCEANRIGEDTTLAGIIRMVSDAAATKAPIAKIADTVSGVFVPVVIIIAVITFIVWLAVGQTVGYAIARAVSVLVISCPCALGLATPVAIMVGNGISARNGILFKTAASLEQTGKTQIITLDKTGTITTGVMKVTDILTADNVEESTLLTFAYALESKSEHPISKAILEYALEKGISSINTTSFESFPGNGLMAQISNDTIAGDALMEQMANDTIAGDALMEQISNDTIAGGNIEFIREMVPAINLKYMDALSSFASEGKTPVLFARNHELLGIIAISDTIKEDSATAISELKAMGLHVIMLSGDNEITANAIASQVGVDEVVAGVKPDGKEQIIRRLSSQGKVMMVGDGINDAPALTRADIGVAIGAGTDIAIDAADVVLMKNGLSDVAAAIRISRATIRNIHENLFWAFIYNIIGIPLAAGCYVVAFGWTLNPMFGAAAMGLSSFCVVTNALRLNLIKPYSNHKDKPIKGSQKYKPINSIQEDILTNSIQKNTSNSIPKESSNSIPKESSINNIEERKDDSEMKITVKGMMCAHCEAHVKKALEQLQGIETAVANHEENLVTITTSATVNEATIKAAVEDAGYEYVGIIE